MATAAAVHAVQRSGIRQSFDMVNTIAAAYRTLLLTSAAVAYPQHQQLLWTSPPNSPLFRRSYHCQRNGNHATHGGIPEQQDPWISPSNSPQFRFQYHCQRIGNRVTHRQLSLRWNSNNDDSPEEIPEEIIDPQEEEIKRITLEWVRRVVIGLNFCPFAERPLREDKLKIHVVLATDEVEIMSNVLYQCISRQEIPGTTLVVAPNCFPNDFESFLSVVTTLEEDLMGQYDLEGEIQIAPFHPLFQFEGSGDGIDNYTNKSPFPIFHILREDEVGKAVESLGGDAGKVWKRNIGLLNDLLDEFGRDGVEDIMSGKAPQDKDLISEVLKRHRLKPSDTDLSKD